MEKKLQINISTYFVIPEKGVQLRRRKLYEFVMEPLAIKGDE